VATLGLSTLSQTVTVRRVAGKNGCDVRHLITIVNLYKQRCCSQPYLVITDSLAHTLHATTGHKTFLLTQPGFGTVCHSTYVTSSSLHKCSFAGLKLICSPFLISHPHSACRVRENIFDEFLLSHFKSYMRWLLTSVRP